VLKFYDNGLSRRFGGGGSWLVRIVGRVSLKHRRQLAELGADGFLNIRRDFGIIVEILAGIFFALADALVFVSKPDAVVADGIADIVEVVMRHKRGGGQGRVPMRAEIFKKRCADIGK
jgi:hypothetical protein